MSFHTTFIKYIKWNKLLNLSATLIFFFLIWTKVVVLCCKTYVNSLVQVEKTQQFCFFFLPRSWMGLIPVYMLSFPSF